MIDILTHKTYYENDIDSILGSLDYAKSLPDTNLKKDIHFYWRVPRDFERKQVLPIKSAIVHNKHNANIYLWSNIDLSNNPLIKPLLPFINLKIWDPIKEIEDSFLRNNLPFFYNYKIDDGLCWLGGDLFRLLCLYKYGGMYIDMDMVVLRDLSPLFPYNFLYQWGGTGCNTYPKLEINGAIMSFSQENENLKYMLQTLTKTFPVQNSSCWGKELYGRTRNPQTYVFPCAWFNTEWHVNIPAEPFIENSQSQKLYDGAFTWHWHNRWDHAIEEKSKFAILEKLTNALFDKI